MKIRSDYVSNSSSSSFIVVLTPNYKFKDFVKDVVKACTKEQDCDYPKEHLAKIDEVNLNNLTYCLNTYVLSFLGSVDYKENSIPGVPLSKNKMYFMTPKTYLSGKQLSEDKKDCAKRLVETAYEIYNGSDSQNDRIELYEITNTTIENTKLLKNQKYKVILPDWCKDLSAVTKRLESGERIFAITLSQGGDGITSGCIYGTNGWDSDFNSKANVEVLGGSAS